MLVDETEFLIAALRGPTPLPELNGLMNCFYADASKAPVEERNTALTRLTELFAMDDVKRAGGVALLCGALVEGGCDPVAIGEPLINRLKAAFDAGDEPALEAFWRPAIAALSISPSVRALGRVLAEPAAKQGKKNAGYWIHTLLSTLENEPIVIIEPATSLGILGRISGVVDNFQLATLTMDAFPYADPSAPRRISKTAADCAQGIGPQQTGEQVTGSWNPSTYKALSPDLTFREGHEHWIWNEGKPADIPLFEGRRAILLAPATYQRSWIAQRTFAKLPARLEIERHLTGDEIHSWLKRMASAAE